ncbi:cytochrome P450 [Coprinopsis cinerea okayama7|uniref:Cytochrome P450 n=1 Tax=Coprinopsis cinerea (strain Okayama-7 / 130 / ATCC MYA-4618 / FGSC 9003) TaxID=240176 RepID=A8PCK2_COPC7|nr:cytochrome P450 [Coprinopsis cinerea okayama7\|eukprot:XP_001840420.2 cytochrome P450 [Coprinopsis cinerea okayama7\
MWSLVLRALAAVFLTHIALKWVQTRLKYRSIRNLPGPPPENYFIGNFKQLFSPNAWSFHRSISETYGGVVKISGLFGAKQLYVSDPKALQHIIIKDQHIYEETAEFTAGNLVLFGPGLGSTHGEVHRKQRKMLNPVFSPAHLRGMVPIFWEVSSKLAAALERKISNNGEQEINMYSWLGRTATELIGQSGLGYSFDSLLDDEDGAHPFTKAMHALEAPARRILWFLHFVFPWAQKIGTPKFQRFLVNIVPWKDLHLIRDLIDTFYATSCEIFERKKRAIEQGEEAMAGEVGRGKDIISVLMAENMKASEEDRLPDEEVLGQISTLAFAAGDTTTNALSRVLWLLCQHPEAQEKLRAEIQAAQSEFGNLDYDRLGALPYLEAVCRETLRLYSPVTFLLRKAKQDAILPFSKPTRGLDGEKITEVHVPKGTMLFISIVSANQNPDLWGPDSYEWKPERWLSTLPEAVTEAKIPGIYANLMTFLGGGRACIGIKFAQLELKVVLCTLLQQFQFSLPKDSSIYWKMATIAKPYLPGEDTVPQLPLIVSRCRAMA